MFAEEEGNKEDKRAHDAIQSSRDALRIMPLGSFCGARLSPYDCVAQASC